MTNSSSEFYYEVMVASPRYHKAEPLTYAFGQNLSVGQVVVAELQRQRVPAVVTAQVPKPRFATKPLIRALDGVILPPHLIKLFYWLASYYPAPSGSILQLLLPSFLTQQSRHIETDCPIVTTIPNLPKDPLTGDQQAALQQMAGNPGGSFMLHGDTGTGKTRLYLELAHQQFLAGKSCLVLTPEIGLTPQLANSFSAAFPGAVVIIHSELTTVQRRGLWLTVARSQTPLIVIGPRSALFAPLHQLGLVVIDEAHDSSYKQEQAPYYQATRAAAQLARLSGASLVMGTATPPIGDYYVFQQKQLPIIRLQQIPGQQTTRQVHVVNLRDKDQFSRSPFISNLLLEKMELAFAAGKQSLLFLNRRGTARLVLCQNCGWQALCPRCDLPLTFHSDIHRLRCHTCGFTGAVPSSCSSCRSTDILFQSIGTKALVSELHRVFPDKTIQRLDADTTAGEQLHQSYDAIKSGKVDIIVGTQMVAKGLDLPLLSVVGIVIADTSLYFPDFTADERTYQLLNQVIGRVGRSHGDGEIVVQSYNPDNPVIVAAATNDYPSFLSQQLQERELFHFPPFYYLLKLTCSRKTAKGAASAASKLYKELQQNRGIEIIGPSPAFTERSNESYKWQLIVRSKQRSRLLDIIGQLPANWHYDIDPANLL